MTGGSPPDGLGSLAVAFDGRASEGFDGTSVVFGATVGVAVFVGVIVRVPVAVGVVIAVDITVGVLVAVGVAVECSSRWW